MLDFIEKILVAVFSVLPDANPDNSVIQAVESSMNQIQPGMYNLNLIFPLSTLFQVLMLVIFVELTLFLISLIMKVAMMFRG